MFKRRGNDTPDVLDQASGDEPEAGPAGRPGYTPAKGRPTPKRSESERQRRQPYSAPGDRKAAAAQGKGDRARRMEAMRRGEDWALPRKDQGPVRALARDVVDSRRGLSEYYLYGIIILIAALFAPGLRGTFAIDYLILIVLAVIVIEGWLVSNKVLKLARERFPGESTHGIRMYTALRGTQIRKMRVPGPRVDRGDKI